MSSATHRQQQHQHHLPLPPRRVTRMPSVNDLVTAKSLQSPLTQLRVGVESRKDEAVRSCHATEMQLTGSLNHRSSIDHYRIHDLRPPMLSRLARLEHLHYRL